MQRQCTSSCNVAASSRRSAPWPAFRSAPSCGGHGVSCQLQLQRACLQSPLVVRAVAGGDGRAEAAGGDAAPVVPLPPPSDTRYAEGEFVELGRVAGAFGVRGEVRIEISTDSPKQRFGQPGKRIFLRRPPLSGLLARAQGLAEPGMLAVTTSSAKIRVLPRGEEAWVVQFRELSDRSQAEQLLNWTLHIPAGERERLRSPDEFWVQDLAGCRVFVREGGAYVGRVVDVISGTGTHDTLVLQLALNRDDVINSRTRQCMVPFAKALCPVVEPGSKQMVIDPPEGLLDLFSYKAMRKLSDAEKAERLQALSTTPVPTLSPEAQQALAAWERAASSSQGPSSTGVSTSEPSAPRAAAKARRAGPAKPAGGARAAPPPAAPSEDAKQRMAAPAAATAGQRQRGARRTADAEGSSSPRDGGGAATQARPEEAPAPAQGGQDAAEAQEGPDSMEKWRLRRKLGVSLASSRRRRLGTRQGAGSPDAE